jgi:hypothetical protein
MEKPPREALLLFVVICLEILTAIRNYCYEGCLVMKGSFCEIYQLMVWIFWAKKHVVFAILSTKCFLVSFSLLRFVLENYS